MSIIKQQVFHMNVSFCNTCRDSSVNHRSTEPAPLIAFQPSNVLNTIQIRLLNIFPPTIHFKFTNSKAIIFTVELASSRQAAMPCSTNPTFYDINYKTIRNIQLWRKNGLPPRNIRLLRYVAGYWNNTI